jgi:hypothetical protein
VRLGSLVVSLAATVSVTVTAPPIARADPVADAKDLFSRGRELRGQGDCVDAVPLFQKAYEIYPSGLGSLRNMAECEEQLGQFASARRTWLELKRALVTVDDKKYDGWSHDAEDAAARLQPKLATLTLDVTAVRPDGTRAPSESVQVKLNGEFLAPSLLGTALERDPGRYVVSVAGPGNAAPEERVVELPAGGSQRLSFRVVVSPAPPTGAEGAPPPASERTASSGSTLRTLGWISLGVGAAGLVGTVVSAVVRQSAIDKITSDGNCQTQHEPWTCPPTEKATFDTGHTASTLFNVLLPVTIVGAATGVVLLLTNQPQAPQAPQAALVVSPTGAWAAGSF